MWRMRGEETSTSNTGTMSASLLQNLRSAETNLRGLLRAIQGIISEVEAIPPDALNEPVIVEGRCKAMTAHAIERFRERTGSKKSDGHIAEQVSAAIRVATELELKAKYRAVELIAHGGQARYFRAPSGLVFVVENEVIVTVHHGEADRWTVKR
jgi:hypothetical protein